MPRLVMLVGSVALFIAFTGSAAPAQEAQWVRAVGGLAQLDIKGAAAHRFSIVCSPSDTCAANGPPVDATITMKVSGATKRKHKLPSTTIAKSEPFEVRGEVQGTDVVMTQRMRRKLKSVSQLKITTQFVVRSPIADTTTKVTTFKIGSGGRGRFCIGTTQDPFPICKPDGAGGGRG